MKTYKLNTPDQTLHDVSLWVEKLPKGLKIKGKRSKKSSMWTSKTKMAAAAAGCASALLCRLTPETARTMVANTKLPLKLRTWTGSGKLGDGQELGEVTKLRVDKDGNVYCNMKLNAAGKAALLPNGSTKQPKLASQEKP